MKTKPAFWARCHGCRVKHPIHASPNDAGVSARFGDFQSNHRSPHCVTDLIPQEHTYYGVYGGRWTDLIRRAFWKSAYALVQDAFADAAYAGNADVKEAFQSIQTLTVTNLSGLTNSATGGWQSAQVDNSSDLYLGNQMVVTNTAVNTAPANSKLIYLYAFGGNATGVLTNCGSGVTGTSEGTLTFPDVTTLPVPGLVCTIPYPVQNKALVSLPFNMALAFGGILPPFWVLAAINYTGMTLGTVTAKYMGTYNTVV